MLFAAALLQAASVFAPPLDAPLRVVTERVETGAAERRFRLERLIRFAREGGGYRAEVVILGTSSDTPEASGALYEAGFGTLAGTVLVLHLDAAGKVSGIDDMAALWTRVCRGVADNAAARRNLPPAERAALARRIAAPLTALPALQQRALLGSLVAAIVSDETGEETGTRPVRLPGTTPLGTSILMEGQRTLSIGADGQGHSVTRAAAAAPIPAEGSAPARTGRIEIEMRRTFDRRTGLLSENVDASVTRLGEGGSAPETRRVTTLRTVPARPEDWPKD